MTENRLGEYPTYFFTKYHIHIIIYKDYKRKGFAPWSKPFSYLEVSCIRLSLFNSSLSRSETCDGHTEGRARYIVETYLVAELN